MVTELSPHQTKAIGELHSSNADTTSLDAERLLDMIQEAKDHILREIGELVSLMEETTKCLCAPCCVKVTNKYSEYIGPLMKEYEELERGDRAQPTSDESDRRTP